MALNFYLHLGVACKIFDSRILLERSTTGVARSDLNTYSPRQPLGERCADDMPVQRTLRSNRAGKAPIVDDRNQSGTGGFGKASLITGSRPLMSLKAGVVRSTREI